MAEEASRAYPNDLEVLLSVGRMLLAHGQLQMAKRHLLGAAKLSAEPRAPRLLGEVLLRQGDAKRAVRALQRAIQLGATDEETHGWYESAAAYVNVQAEQGREAVARAVDDSFGFDNTDIVDEDSDDDAPTMIASAQQEAIMQDVEQLTTLRRQAKPARPERPAVPRDDEATDFVQLTAIAQDGAPTRQADVPGGVAPAELDTDGIVDESTAMMSETEIERLNRIEARRSGKLGAGRVKDPKTEEVDPKELEPVKPAADAPKAPEPEPEAKAAPAEPPPPKKKITEEDSDDAWHMAVQKRAADDAPQSSAALSKPASSRAKKKTNRTGLYVGSAAAAILLTLFAGVRTGRLPELAQHLPPWLSGTEQQAAQAAAPTADPAPPPPTADPASTGATEPAKDGPKPEPKANGEGDNGDAAGSASGQPEPAESAPAPSADKPTKPRPVVVYPRPRPRPKPKTDPKPQPAPPPPADPGAPEEPLWLGDPERN